MLQARRCRKCLEAMPCRGDDVDVGDGAETKNMGRSHFGNFETDRISRMKNKSNVMICYGRTKRLKQPV